MRPRAKLLSVELAPKKSFALIELTFLTEKKIAKTRLDEPPHADVAPVYLCALSFRSYNLLFEFVVSVDAIIDKKCRMSYYRCSFQTFRAGIELFLHICIRLAINISGLIQTQKCKILGEGICFYHHGGWRVGVCRKVTKMPLFQRLALP